MPNSRAACPDYTCNPCKFDEKCPPVNFTGITSIICSYKYDVCDRLRVEHRACLKAQARMCRPVEKQVKTVCTKVVNRAKCKEDEEKLDAGLKDLMAQLDALRALKPCAPCAAPEPAPETYTQGSFTCGSDGEVKLRSEVIGGGASKKGGWFGGSSDAKKEKKSRRVNPRTPSWMLNSDSLSSETPRRICSSKTRMLSWGAGGRAGDKSRRPEQRHEPTGR